MPADFSFIHTKPFSVKMSSEEPGTMTFMAPELLPPTRFGLEKGVPSKEASIHALSMTVVLAGQWPFYPKKEVEVMCAMICGERPPEPENAEEIWITKVVWDLLRECWRSVRILQCRTDMAQRECLSQFAVPHTLIGLVPPRRSHGNPSPVGMDYRGILTMTYPRNITRHLDPQSRLNNTVSLPGIPPREYLNLVIRTASRAFDRRVQ